MLALDRKQGQVATSSNPLQLMLSNMVKAEPRVEVLNRPFKGLPFRAQQFD